MFAIDIFSGLMDCAMFSKTCITFATGLEIARATPFQKALFEKNMVSIPIFLSAFLGF
jgi:hypothetical protein